MAAASNVKGTAIVSMTEIKHTMTQERVGEATRIDQNRWAPAVPGAEANSFEPEITVYVTEAEEKSSSLPPRQFTWVDWKNVTVWLSLSTGDRL